MSNIQDRTYQVTDWGYPGEAIDTGWGKMRWDEYLRKEQTRWASRGRDCEIRTENGEMALFASTGKGWMPKEMDEEQS